MVAGISPAGLATAEALGQPAAGPQVLAAGVPSSEAFGLPVLALGITATGIASAEAIGPAAATGDATITGAGNVSSAEVFGAVSITTSIAARGIASAEAFGFLGMADQVEVIAPIYKQVAAGGGPGSQVGLSEMLARHRRTSAIAPLLLRPPDSAAQARQRMEDELLLLELI